MASCAEAITACTSAHGVPRPCAALEVTVIARLPVAEVTRAGNMKVCASISARSSAQLRILVPLDQS
eukprot:CAMPEP_0194550952 /NCGR_PEP_ID=MMETSP0253-20130528/95976_1 /TAXON_ID=2966 /ORGANISM="Noctiluca scintillans" /LENGTH=66 /DNA_ID=CAMNT_0039398403 /DNA_START=198 /DNA_END=398 /DNA_ORIENTATION=+